MSGQFLSLLCFIEISIFNANSVDPDQMPCSVVSDLGIHCLQRPICPNTKGYYVGVLTHSTRVDFSTELFGPANFQQQVVRSVIIIMFDRNFYI